jgi:branched-chain amino acid transport system substrate-binding protein
MKLIVAAVAAIIVGCFAGSAQAEDIPGVTADQITLGQTAPLTGPAAAYRQFSDAHQAYFRKINDEGGINKRKLRLITRDDSYSPPKTVEQTRRLVEQDRVLAIFGSVGVATMNSVKQYLSDAGVPQLVLGLGTNIWGDEEKLKWVTIWSPDQQIESIAFAENILKKKPNAKIAVLYQNDDFGKNLLVGLKKGLGDKASMIVATASYELQDPTIDSQIISLHGSGADVLIFFSSPRFTVQGMRKAFDLGWKPETYLFSFSTSVKNVMEPVGAKRATGTYSVSYLKEPNDPTWQNDAGMKDYMAWIAKYMPGADPAEPLILQGYGSAQLLVRILRQCGDDLRRENVIKQAKSVKGLQLPMLLPGILIDMVPNVPSGIHKMQLVRFDGTKWTLAEGAR